MSANGISLDAVLWDSFDGGDVATDANPYMAGGMQPQVDLGGIPKRSPITIKREWSDALIAVYKALDQACGSLPMTISATTLTATRQSVGDTTTYTGVLGGVTRPGYDSSTSGLAQLQLVINPNFAIT